MFDAGVANDVCVFSEISHCLGAWRGRVSRVSVFKNQTRPRADRDGVPQSLSKPDTTAKTQITPNTKDMTHHDHTYEGPGTHVRGMDGTP